MDKLRLTPYTRKLFKKELSVANHKIAELEKKEQMQKEHI